MSINVWAIGADSVEKRFKALCDEAGYSPLDVAKITGRRRHQDLIKARAVIACQLRSEGYSLNRIGQAMNRDHTSIMHLIQKYGKLYHETDQNQYPDPAVC